MIRTWKDAAGFLACSAFGLLCSFVILHMVGFI